MELIFQKMFDRAVKDLETLRRKELISYKVLMVGSAEEYGDIELMEVEDKPRKRASRYPHGEMRKYILSYVEALDLDGIVSIPLKDYPEEHVRGNLCAWATTVWGKGSYTSTINREKQTVDIYRHGA
jgi:hypothetical protein